jgi:hypothetical protein
MGDIRGHGDGPSYAWRDLLQRWSDEWLNPVLHEQERAEPFPPEVRGARWLGAGGATGEEVDVLEDRLGAKLPTSVPPGRPALPAPARGRIRCLG